MVLAGSEPMMSVTICDQASGSPLSRIPFLAAQKLHFFVRNVDQTSMWESLAGIELGLVQGHLGHCFCTSSEPDEAGGAGCLCNPQTLLCTEISRHSCATKGG
uniref:Uncharacterized protein n=1 Tax=Eutreptiella gymnastica TaxID=73025 RepID=A0A7S1HT04_9EUGL|mmetsp:Transcript_103013/g.177713  ORF Transcript_103013/g.177713 Transcript_103013/m.177713 type:complete len:103 (+) Transcript_103013:649-957(+)